MPDSAADRPNVLVFFCDQLRIDLLGAYGGEIVRTPNLDALAEESIVFEQARTPCALCSPARASLMTGLYPHAHHMFNNSTPRYSYCQHLRPDLQTLAEWADEETGHETAYAGKWHIGPAEDLFASSFHHTHPRPYEGGPPYLSSSHWHPSTALAEVGESLARGRAGTLKMPMGRFPDVFAADLTRDFVRSREVRGAPFVSFCAFPGPHSPWFVPDEFGIRYDPAEIPMWPNRDDDFAGKPVYQKKLRLHQISPEGHSHLPDGDDQLRELLAGLFSYMELIDQQVGRVLDALRDADLYDDTMVVFTADHGDMAGSHGFLSKGGYMYEETSRIPMIMKPAAETRPRRIAEPVHLMDLTATMMHAMSGREVERMATHELHGRSLLPLIDGTADRPREVHYAQYHGDWYGHYSARMVTDGRWKLVFNLTDYCELYDLEDDPGELHNRFYDPEVRDIRDRYMELLFAEAERLEDGQLRLYEGPLEDEIPRDFDEPLPSELRAD
jgi:arylsulfatase A-like enzyme